MLFFFSEVCVFCLVWYSTDRIHIPRDDAWRSWRYSWGLKKTVTIDAHRHAFNFGSMNYRHYRHFRIQKFSIVLKMLIVQILEFIKISVSLWGLAITSITEMYFGVYFCIFNFIHNQHFQHNRKFLSFENVDNVDSSDFRIYELWTFWVFCNCKVCKMRKVQISYNEYYYGFYEFCDGCFDFPVDMPLEHCGYCLSGNNRLCLFIVYLLLHFSSAIADFCRKAAPYALLVSGLRQKCYGVTSGNFAVCKFALRTFVPAVSLPFRNNFSSAVNHVRQWRNL